MKKAIALLLAIAALAAVFTGCASAGSKDKIKIAALKGPTGMGMTFLFEKEYADKYSISLSGAPDDITSGIISGETDIAAVPINLASALYNKTNGDIVMLAINTLGVLYILDSTGTVNTVSDLSGKTVYTIGQGSTPEYMLDYILKSYNLSDDVNVKYSSENAELATLVSSGEVEIAMLPEPNVTSVLVKNQSVRSALSITDLWHEATGLAPVQGCIIARRKYVENNKAAIDMFLADYRESVNYVNSNHKAAAALMEAHEIIPNAALAKAAIPNCNIVFVDGDEMKSAAGQMLEILHSENPKSIGGSLPADDFYYGG